MGDEEHYGIARLNTDGSVDGVFTVGVDGGVMTIAVQEDGQDPHRRRIYGSQWARR